MNEERTSVLIIGAGPAGYTAAIYASRANRKPIVFEGMQPGGQIVQTTEIENFPGFPEGIGGMALMENFRDQAIRFGADIRSRTIAKVDFSKRPFICEDEEGDRVIADSVIICTGGSARYLGLADEEKYKGMGVSVCATCDGFFYRKKVVAVVGGGDTACEEALYLAGLAKKVFLIVRKNYLRASEVMKRRVAETENIEILFECNVLGLDGDGVVEKAHVVRGAGTPEEDHFEIDIDGFFLAIGNNPNTGLFKGQIDLDSAGYIQVKYPSTATNVEGVFAAGDCVDSAYRQVVVAAGTGARAAIDADRFLMEH